MSERRYYTPDSSEFFIGFECQILSSWGWQEGCWPDVLKSDSLAFQAVIDKGEIKATMSSSFRVKYLDRADLEQLGWNYTGRSVCMWFTKVAFRTPGDRHPLSEYKLLFCPDNQEVKINGYFGGQDEGCLFEGIVQNKSEMKRIMYNHLKMEN